MNVAHTICLLAIDLAQPFNTHQWVQWLHMNLGLVKTFLHMSVSQTNQMNLQVLDI